MLLQLVLVDVVAVKRWTRRVLDLCQAAIKSQVIEPLIESRDVLPVVLALDIHDVVSEAVLDIVLIVRSGDKAISSLEPFWSIATDLINCLFIYSS